MKFKVGDRVVVKRDALHLHRLWRGMKAKILRVDSDVTYPYCVRGSEGQVSVRADELDSAATNRVVEPQNRSRVDAGPRWMG